MILFYSEECDGQTARLVGSEASHCVQALRRQIGDEVYVTDGLGQCFKGEITAASKKSVDITITEEIILKSPRNYHIHIGIAPTKNNSRFEWFLEKATEFGIDEITPLKCARSERKLVKPDRLSKIILSAMKQSLKTKLPVLNPMVQFQDFVSGQNHDQMYIAHLEEKPELLIHKYKSGKNATILIGPEGDFTSGEINLATSKGAKAVSLGDYRLRTETAGIAAVQLIHFVNQAGANSEKGKSNQ
ncbi:16S rRNA (uracil(1498)-N(3))-methyltransferase [Portibacter marinus]|uniref:16S rRNA (uracil(1498)-N(3))-methyltransferase n=1 Tax=Portibacter marinus TaxID=2898660 RepID=UPI001F340A2A|nr:16S rRNA (uracil(1498)-N(3))-methyltransferase [Portibacter marinus]